MKHPEVPWRDIAGFRDKVVHGYFGVDLEVVWDTAVEDAPLLKLLIAKILDEMEAGSCWFSRIAPRPSFASGARSPFRYAQEDLFSEEFYNSIFIFRRERYWKQWAQESLCISLKCMGSNRFFRIYQQLKNTTRKRISSYCKRAEYEEKITL